MTPAQGFGDHDPGVPAGLEGKISTANGLLSCIMKALRSVNGSARVPMAIAAARSMAATAPLP